jgi:hypothetical protein
MSSESESQNTIHPDIELTRWQHFRAAAGAYLYRAGIVLDKIGAGFAEDNKGLEHGSRVDRIVASTVIPDKLPDNWGKKS